MRRLFSPLVFVALVLMVSCGAGDKPASPATPEPAAAPTGPLLESIQIAMQGTATSDGELRIEFTPDGGETKAIVVKVATTIPSDEVVRDLRTALKASIYPDYLVDRWDPDKIRIALNKQTTPFRLRVAALTANGLTIRLE